MKQQTANPVSRQTGLNVMKNVDASAKTKPFLPEMITISRKKIRCESNLLAQNAVKCKENFF